MEVRIRFNDECEWTWEDWVAPYIKAVFLRAGINTEEIYAKEMDEDNIFCGQRDWTLTARHKLKRSIAFIILMM